MRFIEIDPRKLLENEDPRVNGKPEGSRRLDITAFCKQDGEAKFAVFRFQSGRLPKFKLVAVHAGQDVEGPNPKHWTCDETGRHLECDAQFVKQCESWGANPRDLAEAITSFAHR